jgi:hypothetical protein
MSIVNSIFLFGYIYFILLGGYFFVRPYVLDFINYIYNRLFNLNHRLKYKTNWHKIHRVSQWCCSIGRHDFYLDRVLADKVILICNDCPKRREIERFE